MHDYGVDPRPLLSTRRFTPAAHAIHLHHELSRDNYLDFCRLHVPSCNARIKDAFLGDQYFTGEFRLDDVFHHSFNRPADHTIGG